MKIDRIPEGARDPRTSALARARLSDVQGIDGILAFVSAERAAHLDSRIFITLDDLARASYTSMHAGESDELEVETEDLDFLNAIAGFLQGYFSVDWGTFQNYAVTRHLAGAYGYRPLGIGASWIGFERDIKLSGLRRTNLSRNSNPSTAVLTLPDGRAKRTLFLGCTKNFAA